MIRVRIKRWNLERVRVAVATTLYAAGVLWGGAGWMIMVPFGSRPDRDSLVSVPLGFALYLGPFALAGALWVIHHTFEFSFESPFDRVPRD